MIRAAHIGLIYLLLAVAVWHITAGMGRALERVTIQEPGSPGCFAEIFVLDLAGIYNKDVSLDTSLGAVVVRYETLTSHADPDFAEVISLPPNVVAQPQSLHLVPSETSVICLIEWQGM